VHRTRAVSAFPGMMFGMDHRPDWQRELRALVDRAVLAGGRDAVSTALSTESDRLSADEASGHVVVDRPVLGLEPTQARWVGVLLVPGRPAATVAGATISALVELARESVDLAVVALGLPRDLPDDRLQSLRREVDSWLQSKPTVALIEVDPETSAARLAGHSLTVDADTDEGAAERRRLLADVGLVAPAWFRGSGFDERDLLDACTAAWSALRWSHGEAEVLHPPTEVAVDGRATAIWV
jgi:hypothetical protein